MRDAIVAGVLRPGDRLPASRELAATLSVSRMTVTIAYDRLLRAGFIIAPHSLQAAIHRAKFLTDWHSPTFLQAALARFLDDGHFARHLRRVTRVYRERHEMIAAALAHDFSDDVELIPSTTGLHMAAFARTASVERIEAVARRAFEVGVPFRPWPAFRRADVRAPGLCWDMARFQRARSLRD